MALRYANVCGPRQDPKSEAGVVSIFVSRLLAGQPLSIFGDGKQTRDYVSVKDVARANVLASSAALPADADHDARAFNIATGIERTVLELAEAAGRVTGRTAGVADGGRPAGRDPPQRARREEGRRRARLAARSDLRRRPRDAHGLVPNGGVMLLQVGGAVPRTSLELLQQSERRDQGRPRHHRALLASSPGSSSC